MTLQGSLWYNARDVYFEGIRTGVLPIPKQGIPTIEQLWEQRVFKEPREDGYVNGQQQVQSSAAWTTTLGRFLRFLS